ncbi:DUF6115 domain-containing protein [Catonella massiliensis]|jgi:hypothetical protein|uniref:Helix-turn-helix domain-containing protein n=1 Tax=Catonella massiliensis TaxID=2799636 RepID=A0ABS1J078_9FIRM|nr:DUF6115 domain-containing protein [Catonella massiliensis]MBF1013927.1 hypothetical protein [Lachnospiraceae bacterium]MBK5897467.1 hypothetical protein [Catonella massiliensis]
MDIIVIICLIIGVGCIGASFFIKEKADIDNHEKEKIAEEIRGRALSEDSVKKVMTRVEKGFSEKLSAISEDKLGGFADKMSEIANDKMLAINDMSGQLMEKIEQNHKEVIFLYDMLNEKSDYLKDFSAKIDGLRHELEREEERIKALNNDLDDKMIKVKEVRQTVIAKPVAPVEVKQEKSRRVPTGIEQAKAAIKPAEVPAQAKNLVKMKKEVEDIPSDINDIFDTDERDIFKDAEVPEITEEIDEIDLSPELTEELSTNDKILKMHSEGKSVMEISKELGMGQGEVQLILGLYGK